MMVQAKRIYMWMIKVNKLIFFFLLQCFLREIENMFSAFLLSYRNTHESLGELEKAVEKLTYGSCCHSISHSPKLLLVFLKLDRNTVHVFYFWNGNVRDLPMFQMFSSCQKTTLREKNSTLYWEISISYRTQKAIMLSLIIQFLLNYLSSGCLQEINLR